MQRLARKFWNLVRFFDRQGLPNPQRSARQRCRLKFESLENRLTPATTGFTSTVPAVLSGTVYLNSANVGGFDPGDTVIPGASVTLTGTTIQGTAVNTSTTTDANGNYTFFQLQPGTYSLTQQSNFVGGEFNFGNLGGTAGTNTISGISVAEGQAAINYNLAVRGLSANFVSLRAFLNTTTNAGIPFQAAGSGSMAVDGTVQPATAATGGTSSLAGAVLDSNNKGIAGVEVILTGLDNTGADIFQPMTTAAGTGAYQFGTLQPGSYTLNVASQPAGFRADAPVVGTQGGLVFRNDQIVDITLGTGTTGTGTGYNFKELPLSTQTSTTGPAIAAALADDTQGPTSGTTSDGITSDPSILGSIVTSGSLSSFKAGFDATPTANFTSILGDLTSSGTFYLNPGVLAQIDGGALSVGPHTLHLQATNAQGQVGTATVTFNLQNTPPPLTLTSPTSINSQDAAEGILRTTNSTVTLTGQTEAGVQIQLIQANAATQTIKNVGSSGTFSFNVTLGSGANDFTLQAIDSAGNTSELSRVLVHEAAPKAVPTTPVQETVGQTGTDQFIDLSSPTIFTNPEVSGTIVSFNTSAGPLNMVLSDTVTPQTVANFLTYINSGQYSNDIFHRLDTNPPVLQGGGFTLEPGANPIQPLDTSLFPTVPNEFSNANPNVAGTIAMAKPSNQNGASSEFFFNLADNSVTLDGANNGGFTVFGKVASGADQRVLNTLAAFPTQNESTFNQGFNVFPLKNYTGGTNFPAGITAANLALINGASAVQQTDQLTYSVTNSNPSIVSATVNKGQLDLKATGTTGGTATIKVTATNEAGSASVTFTVNVGPVSVTNPGNQNDAEGDSVNLQINATEATTGKTLTYSATGLPTGLSIGSSTGLISGTISQGADTSSPYTTVVTVTDGTSTASQTFIWTVFPLVTVNPVANQTNKEGDTVNLQLSGTDAKNSALSFVASNLPTGLQINSATGLIFGNISAGAHLSSPFTTTVTANDTTSVSGSTFSGSQTFTWTVNPVVTVSPISAQRIRRETRSCRSR